MPALTRAQRIGEKVARVGFDWEDARGSRAKVTEELAELDAAVAGKDAKAIEEEMGDVLFALVNLVAAPEHRRRGGAAADDRQVHARGSRTSRSGSRENHGGWGEPGVDSSKALPLAMLDWYWEEAKAAERG